jgi:hypothetical protein
VGAILDGLLDITGFRRTCNKIYGPHGGTRALTHKRPDILLVTDDPGAVDDYNVVFR